MTETLPATGIAESVAFPLSFAQQRLWFLAKLEPGSSTYNVPLVLRLRGRLDARALERAFGLLIERHETLRTTFVELEGEPVQVVHPQHGEYRLEVVDVSGAADPEAEALSRAVEEASRPFDLAAAPAVRTLLVRVAEDEHLFVVTLHHIITDAWSSRVLLRELAELYGSVTEDREPQLPEISIQYGDYAVWQHDWFADGRLAEEIEHWRRELDGAPATLELPFDRPRPPVKTDNGAHHRVQLPSGLAAQLEALGRAEGATLFMTLLAAFSALLSRYSGQDDIVVGTPVANRNRLELEGLIGFFTNTLPLRIDTSGDPSFRELVRRARETALRGFAHHDLPFEQLVAELNPVRSRSHSPLFQVLFQVHEAGRQSSELSGLTMERVDIERGRAKFDLALTIEHVGPELRASFEYNTDLFDAETVARFESHFVGLLVGGLVDPDCVVGRLPLVSVGEREALVGVGAVVAEFGVWCVHERFAVVAGRCPDAVAVSCEGVSLTYGELDARANAVAHRLCELGVGRGSLVGLCLGRGVELVVAVLGVLKAGGAYVPLDPEYPVERLAFVLEDACPVVVVTEEGLRERLPSSAVVVSVDGDLAGLSGRVDPPVVGSEPGDLAYVIYTSGSTGRPKGVLVEHRNVARLFSATEEWFSFSAADTWLLFHSYAFDFSVWELWGALLYGGRLVVPPHWTTRSPQLLAEVLVRERVSVLNATPSLFVMVLEELLAVADRLALRVVVFGGEALRPSALAGWFARFGDGGPRLVNMYGITETTVHVTYRPLTAADSERDVSPIGRPIPDLSVFVLDRFLEPVPVGVVGELYVGGAGVARGYLNRPELTGQRFLPNPFGPGRLYRSGDLARRRSDGELEFLGRADQQVKIRGFRIELGEIEAALTDHPAVSEAAVRPLEVAAGDTRLAAYLVTTSTDPDRLLGEVRHTLETRLPAYMIPTSLTILDRLPLTTNGKLDTNALPPPLWEREEGDVTDDEPATETELAVAALWGDVLGVEKLGRNDSFFHLGGHSLLAARAVTQARDRFQVKLSVRSVFEHPTLAEFAAYIDGLGGRAAEIREEPAPPEASAARRTYPVSANQQQLLFFDQLDRGSPVYNAGLAVGISGPLDAEALERAIDAVIARHEALRTVLVWRDGVPEQSVPDEWSFTLERVDLTGRRHELAARLRDDSRLPFALDRDLMLRATLFRLDDDEHVLLFRAHHIAVDAWSVEILFSEVEELYAAAVVGRSPDLAAPPVRYGDFALWQRDRLRGRRLEEEHDYWRKALAGAPTSLPLPVDHARSPVQRFEGATHEVLLDDSVSRAIVDAAREEGVTPYMFLLAAFSTLLYRVTGQDDILLGSPFANRGRPEFQQLVGYFANTLVVRARLAGNPSFRELLDRVRTTTLELLDHQELAFESIVEAVRPPRDGGVNPLFQVNFRVRVDPSPTLNLEGATTVRLPVEIGLARFDLAVEVHVHEQGVLAEFNYDTALFDRETVEQLAGAFVELLAQVLEAPETRLLELRVPSEIGAAAGTRRAGPIRRSRR